MVLCPKVKLLLGASVDKYQSATLSVVLVRLLGSRWWTRLGAVIGDVLTQDERPGELTEVYWGGVRFLYTSDDPSCRPGPGGGTISQSPVGLPAQRGSVDTLHGRYIHGRVDKGMGGAGGTWKLG